MKIAMFYHSLLSDWNHGNAHFLRGMASELLRAGHDVTVYEPADAWSLANLLEEHGKAPIEAFRRAYPGLDSVRYRLDTLDLDAALDGTDLVLVHEWNDAELVDALSDRRRRSSRFRLLFHDTHHRSATAPEEMIQYDLSECDGVLAFGQVIRDLYLRNRWAPAAWTWHEAADVHRFAPPTSPRPDRDLVWIGNWGDDERTEDLEEFLLRPVRELGLNATVYGVRYPQEALDSLADAGIRYGGWLPNFRVPEVFARHRLTVHIPRRPYAEALPGVPTIRVFEALACRIPLISAPWSDAEGLFKIGRDLLMARDGDQMIRHIRRLLDRPDRAAAMAARGRRTVLRRHTCAHRADELMRVCREIGLGVAPHRPEPAHGATLHA